MRVLCPRLRSGLGGLGDIEAPLGELARVSLRPQAVLIVENQATGVALPDMDGIELIRAVRSEPSPPPIIAMSGFQEGGMLPAAQQLGAVSCFTKPFDLVQMLQAIAGAL